VIKSFADLETHELWRTGRSRSVPAALWRVALRKLWMLHNAASLDDLRVPPGNRLEALRGDRKGQFSIRINDQYRVCFQWIEGHAHQVVIVDYH
jgi:proteic killer suppression protein